MENVSEGDKDCRTVPVFCISERTAQDAEWGPQSETNRLCKTPGEMRYDNRVTLTLVCIGCRREQVIQVPLERGVPPGRHYWECFPCQEKKYGPQGFVSSAKGDEERTRRGGGNKEPSKQEG
ncbi:MAG: hypothetical protein OHK0028_22590 [Deltaproteobacteria bacterium]